MPLNLLDIQKKLIDKLDSFKAYNKDMLDELTSFQSQVPSIFAKDYSTLMNELASSEEPVGAFPSEEYKKGILLSFHTAFKDPQNMLSWANTYLSKTIVAGSDGSQIYNSAEYNIPVAIVQSAFYANFHTKDMDYIQKQFVQVFGPEDIQIQNPLTKTIIYPQESIDSLRFEQEINALLFGMGLIKSGKFPKTSQYSSKTAKPPTFLIDGTIVLSFVHRFDKKNQKKHFNIIKKALNISEMHKFPIIGYIDGSKAKDVADMLVKASSNQILKTQYISDAKILEFYFEKSLNTALKLGDRSCSFICDRDEEIYQQYDKIIGHKIAFFYIKLSSEQMARVEFPAWVLNIDGLIDHIANILVAETIIGSGYPYTIDQCHHYCVIENHDRMKFYRQFQDFSEKNGLNFKIKNKARSKLRRK